jgi:membrane protease YdiL (CAAX protease family)
MGLTAESICLYLSWSLIAQIVAMAFGGPSLLAMNVAGTIVTIITVVYIASRDRGVWHWGRPTWPWGMFVVIPLVMIGRGEAGLANAAATAPSIFRPAQSVALEIVVNAPIREEIFWRGLVLRGLAAITGFWPALVISALPFGLVHLGGEPIGFLGAYAAGIWLGVIYSPFWGTGSMAMTMVLHMLFNVSARLPPPPPSWGM